uniref:Lysine transporter LysE n=1 Tax=OCS116 cluster bacterium TaxID=2030921 RepID=A0A2A4Z0Z1_9PROT
MDHLDLVLTYALFVLATVGTPGPNVVMIAASGANFGIKRSIPHIMGVVFGFIFMMALVGAGLGQIFDLYPFIHDILRYIGAAFMLYLAYKIATAKNNMQNGKAVGKPLTFIQASAFQWVNPKAWVMIIGAVAQFLTVGGDKFTELSIIITVHLIVSLPMTFAWCLFGREIGRLLKSELAFRVFNYIMASLLVIAIFTLFL